MAQDESLPEADLASAQALQWPTLNHAVVYHIGRLDPALKAKTGYPVSFEGNGLSVSLHPHAWQQIAKLGGEPLWRLSAPDQGAFLDFNALQDRHLAAIMQWAHGQGLAEPATFFKVSWNEQDDNGDVERRFDLYDTGQADAQQQAEADLWFREEDEQADAKMTQVQGWRALPALHQRIGFHVETTMVQEMISTLFVEDVLHADAGVHGVWWDNVLDPCAYKAPKGVIHCPALARWGRQEIDFDQVREIDDDPDDDEPDEDERCDPYFAHLDQEDALREAQEEAVRQQRNAAWTEVQQALLQRDWPAAGQLLRQHGQMVLDHACTASNPNGEDLLTHFGRDDGHHDVFCWLLDHGAKWVNVQPRDPHFQSDGCVAYTLAWSGALRNLRHLVEFAGAQVLDTVSLHRANLMHAAVHGLRSDVMLYLLEHRPHLLHQGDSFGQKPMDHVPATREGLALGDALKSWQAREAVRQALRQDAGLTP